MGTQELEGKNINFVVMHDFFDTFESIQIFFQRLVKKYVGCQVLILNTPGQGETRWGNTGPTAAERKHGGFRGRGEGEDERGRRSCVSMAFFEKGRCY